MLNRIKNKIIVSVQAMPNEPLYKEECMLSMMQSVVNGGAGGLRVAGKRDVINAKKLGVPVIGITKPEKLPDNFKEVVYITPTLIDVQLLIEADADIIAFDGTARKRPGGCSIADIVYKIKSAGKVSMADISTYEEAKICSDLGVDILSTTLSGYTLESISDSKEPDYELLRLISSKLNVPVILEGRIWDPSQVNKAFELGAHAVVIGSAITRPQLITKRFIDI